MTDRVAEALAPLLPLRIEAIDYNDPMVVLSGSGWALSVACPWYLKRDEELLTSYGDDGTAEVLARLVGTTVVSFDRVEASCVRQLELAQGAVLEIVPDTDLDPWVLRVRERTFVGTATSR
jgi:hypothetical protein